MEIDRKQHYIFEKVVAFDLQQLGFETCVEGCVIHACLKMPVRIKWNMVVM